jgi:dihydroflavonol-4-reductase
LEDVLPHPAVETVSCRLADLDAVLALANRSHFVIYSAIPYAIQSIGQTKTRERSLVAFESFLKNLAESKVRKSVFVSVVGTIGQKAGKTGDETFLVSDKDLQKSAGIREKVEHENLIFKYVKRGLRAAVVNPSMVVGDFDTKPSTGEYFSFISRCPFLIMSEEQVNIVDVADVGEGTVLALEKGVVGQRYLLGGANTTFGVLTKRIRALHKRPTSKWNIPRWLLVSVAYLCECLNVVARRPKPLVPLMGIEFIAQGSQHLNCEKAVRELGFAPHDPWLAVARGYQWYKQNGIV